MGKILFGAILGVAIMHFGIVPIAQFIDRTYDSTVQLVSSVTKR
jgi:predicted small secreted protein